MCGVQHGAALLVKEAPATPKLAGADRTNPGRTGLEPPYNGFYIVGGNLEGCQYWPYIFQELGRDSYCPNVY